MPKATGVLTPFHPAVTVVLKLSRSPWSWLHMALKLAGAEEHWAAARPAWRHISARQKPKFRFMACLTPRHPKSSLAVQNRVTSVKLNSRTFMAGATMS